MTLRSRQPEVYFLLQNKVHCTSVFYELIYIFDRYQNLFFDSFSNTTINERTY